MRGVSKEPVIMSSSRGTETKSISGDRREDISAGVIGDNGG